MIDFNQCDGKKCTGRKLSRFKLLKSLKDKKKKYHGIVLSANGKKTVSLEDIEIIKKHGLCVIDCSWNRI
jgi:pre-rRNA-processing protein TSR3